MMTLGQRTAMMTGKRQRTVGYGTTACVTRSVVGEGRYENDELEEYVGYDSGGK